MQTLWLRYLLEIKNMAREIPSDLLEVPLIRKACDLLEESNFTEAEYYAYEKFWDIVAVDRMLYDSNWRRGREEGLKEGREGGEKKKQTEIARKMKATGMDTDMIANVTGLSPEEIAAL